MGALLKMSSLIYSAYFFRNAKNIKKKKRLIEKTQKVLVFLLKNHIIIYLFALLLFQN